MTKALPYKMLRDTKDVLGCTLKAIKQLYIEAQTCEANTQNAKSRRISSLRPVWATEQLEDTGGYKILLKETRDLNN